MKKLVKVHMLPTKDKSHIQLRSNKSGTTTLINYKYSLGCFNRINQHLYFTSGEVIKEGDNCIDIRNNTVFLCTSPLNNPENFRKVVATTDKSLKTSLNTHSELHSKGVYTLPQIPLQFIEDYCKTGDINEIYIEMEEYIVQPYFGNIKQYNDIRIKLDSNNCVIIHLVKDSWNRKEIEILFNRYNEFISHHEPNEWQDWINKNLK